MPDQQKPKGIGIMIAVGKPRGGRGLPPPPVTSRQQAAATSQADPSEPDADDLGAPQPQPQGGGGQKASRDEAGYVPMERACGACLNYHPDTGECDKVQGLFRCCDSCEAFFKPANPNFLHINVSGGIGPTPSGSQGEQPGGGELAGLSPGAY